MKTRIFLIAMLLSVTPFLQSAKAPAIQQASQQLAWVSYCGFLSAGCNGNITIQIDSDGTSAYVTGLAGGGVPLSYSVVSVTPVSGSVGVFSININFMCNGVWTNYTGGAYTSPC